MSVKKYLKFDSELGYLDNKDDINYFATNQLRKVAFGKMLGDFDESGLYVINAKIVEELIKMPKVVVDMMEGADLIRSTVKADAFFHFILTIEDNKATFKLLEKMHYQSNRDFNAGTYSNINEYVIDEVIIPDKDFDRNALYQKYNISTDNNGEVLSIFDMDELSLALYYNIIEKIKVNYLVQNQLILKEKELEAVEADYFEAVLEILEDFKEFGQKVTSDVKNDLAEKHTFVIISKPFFQHTVNEVLDSYIEQYISELTPEQKEQFLIRFREVKEKYYQEFKKLLPIKIEQKAGVRFDNNQVVQEGIIGSLAQEIMTKGFASSDVRKLLIDENELQLSIAKIREMIRENEETCKRDNAKAKDITEGRKNTSKFYEELEKENKVDILKPDTTLIKSTIEEKNVKETKTSQNDKTNKKEQTKTSASNVTANKKRTVTAVKTKGGSPKKVAKKPASVKKSGVKGAKAPVATVEEQKEAEKLFLYGTGASQKKETVEETEFDKTIDDAMITDRIRQNSGFDTENNDVFIRWFS